MNESCTNWTGVAFGVLLGTLAAYQQFKLPPTLPMLLDRYGYDRVLAGGYMSAYAMAGLLLSLPLGRAMQRLGTGRFLYIAYALFILGNLLTLWLPEYGMLVLFARGLEGSGFAILAIAFSMLANVNAAQRHLPVVAALVATWIPAGLLTANILAPSTLAAGAWQPLWWIAIVLTLAMAGWTYRLERRQDMMLNRRMPRTITMVEPASPSAGETRSLYLAAACFMLWSIQMLAFLTWLPQYLVDTYGVSPVDAVFIYSLPVVVVLICNLAGGAILRAGVPLGGLLALTLGVQSTIWWLVPWIDGDAEGLLLLFAYGIATGITPTCLFAAPSTILGTRRAGAHVFAVLMTGRNLGVLIGPILMAWAFKSFGGWPPVLPVFGVVGIAGTAAATALAYRLRHLPH